MRGITVNLSVAVSLWFALTTLGLEPQPGADRWLTNAPPLPEPYEKLVAPTNQFTGLKAEIVADKLRLSWETPMGASEVKILASAGSPGHWPARDWRTRPMHRTGSEWTTEVPVDSLDVPIIYFAIVRTGAKTNASPMRIVLPGALGLEQPSRIFWPFMEGFEQGLEGWRLSDGTAPLTGVPPKNGRASLSVRVPEDRRSVSVMTTRAQGWFLEEHQATGMALWLRTKSGNASATFTLIANAHSTNQIIARRSAGVSISDRWKLVELPFHTFPKLPIGEIDLFSIELTAKPGTEILLDDVQLLGRWRTEL